MRLKSVRRCAVGLLILLVGALAPAVNAAVTVTVRESAAPCLNLRSSPRSDARVLGCLSVGEEVEILEQAPYWRKVRTGSRLGWVAKKFLEDAEAAEGPTAEDRWLEVHFVDVGQGDAIWIVTPDDGIANGKFEGKNVVIDGGPDGDDAKNAFLGYLRAVAHPGAVIDAMFITHPHDDHYPGATGLLRNFDVRAIYDSGYPKEGPKFARLMALVNDEPEAKIMVGRESFEPLDWGDELKAEVLYAYDPALSNMGRGNTLENSASIVLRLEYGSHTFLLMGDAEGKDKDSDPAVAKYVEELLLREAPARLKATVLKVGHHGSETSSSEPFIRAVGPEIVVVMSGRRAYNGTYLPRPSTLERFCCQDPGIRIYRTDQDDELEGRTTGDDADGDHVVIRTNGSSLEVRALSNGRPITVGACEPRCANR